MLVGVDIGGTFTDFVSINRAGILAIAKRFSTPHDPAEAMLAGLRVLGDQEAIDRVIHGSTVATNAILERKGAKTALITTQGFADILAIGRQNRPVLYALQPSLAPLLIPREYCYEVPERLDYTGAVVTPLDARAVDTVLDKLSAERIESVAVCLLYSYLNPAHEQAVKARILERGLLDEMQIALSSDVLPEFREYERASTVALEAYVRPKVSRYLYALERNLPANVALRVMKSDGGVVSARRASQRAIQTALSGPAAGVIGAFYTARLAGYDHIITLDIGGTSTDVSLCPGGPVRYPEREIDGLPLRTPTLDIETVGAGGGSIARLDAGGALRVGPESAGADPGSIIYGRGGNQITISDANAVLGRLDSAHFLGGAMPLDMAAARSALDTLGAKMGLSGEAAAAGIIEIANVKIDQAIRRVSVARGYDPRDFTLVAFGGAGPLHACEVAERLSITRVLIPRYPGAMCAFGLLTADVVLDYSQPILGQDADASRLQPALEVLVGRARLDLAAEGIADSAMIFNGTVDLRYKGQAYELSIPFAPDLIAAFHPAHARRYGYSMPDRPVEAVNLRLKAVGITDKPALTPEPLVESILTRSPAYERDTLSPGARLGGPALIFQLDSTVYLAPGWSATVDGFRNLLLERISP